MVCCQQISYPLGFPPQLISPKFQKPVCLCSDKWGSRVSEEEDERTGGRNCCSGVPRGDEKVFELSAPVQKKFRKYTSLVRMGWREIKYFHFNLRQAEENLPSLIICPIWTPYLKTIHSHSSFLFYKLNTTQWQQWVLFFVLFFCFPPAPPQMEDMSVLRGNKGPILQIAFSPECTIHSQSPRNTCRVLSNATQRGGFSLTVINVCSTAKQLSTQSSKTNSHDQRAWIGVAPFGAGQFPPIKSHKVCRKQSQ